jgi:hypothetical protein
MKLATWIWYTRCKRLEKLDGENGRKIWRKTMSAYEKKGIIGKGSCHKHYKFMRRGWEVNWRYDTNERIWKYVVRSFQPSSLWFFVFGYNIIIIILFLKVHTDDTHKHSTSLLHKRDIYNSFRYKPIRTKQNKTILTCSYLNGIAND